MKVRFLLGSPFSYENPRLLGGYFELVGVDSQLTANRFQALNTASIWSAAARLTVGKTVEYVSIVRLICECPRISCTVSGWTFCASNESRMCAEGRELASWQLGFAESSTSVNALLTLRSSNGEPSVEVNTTSEPCQLPPAFSRSFFWQVRCFLSIDDNGWQLQCPAALFTLGRYEFQRALDALQSTSNGERPIL